MSPASTTAQPASSEPQFPDAAHARILLVGDFMLDCYQFGDVERISPEAPVPVLLAGEEQERLGGAGFVALNVLALGAQVSCFGTIGNDAAGQRMLAQLRAAGAEVSGLQHSDLPSIRKVRIIGLAEHRHRQQLLRIDHEVIAPPSPAAEGVLLAAFGSALKDARAVCLQDYGKGLLTPALCAALIGAAREARVPVLVDPARVGSWDKYAGATLMTPNRAELEIGAGRRLAEHEIEPAARAIVERLRLECLVVTLGRDGGLLVRGDGSAERFPTVPRAVYDNTGAGDAVLSMLAVALAGGAGTADAVRLANIAGGIEVSKFGCVPVTRAEVLHELQNGADAPRGKLRSVPELLAELQPRRNRGETVVFTNGCFDLLHPGHVDLLEKARGLGSVLVVAINSDASVRAQEKGDDRPIREQIARARMLAGLQAVDYVVIFDEPDPVALLRELAPDVLVKGGDYTPAQVVGREVVEARGGRVVVVPFLPGFSTTSELQRIRGK